MKQRLTVSKKASGNVKDGLNKKKSRIAPAFFLIYSRFPISSFELLECRLHFHGYRRYGRLLFHPFELQISLLLLQELHWLHLVPSGSGPTQT